MRMTGREFKAFLNDPLWWPQGLCFEDEEVTIDGESATDDDLFNSGERVEDTSQIHIRGGHLFWNDYREESPAGMSLEAYAQRWMAQRDWTQFVVECRKDRVDELKDTIRREGGKIVE